MKKLLTILLLFAGVVALASCKKEDTTKPEIKGVDAVEISVGDTFDPKVGVTATDDVDGDITASIVVDGTVNVERAGTYELKYTVSDKAGNTAEKKRVVVVLGLAGLANGDFADGLEGWTQWYDESKNYEVTYAVENGKAVIDIKSDPEDKQWWGVQLSYKALKLTKFESYTLKFTVSAENERYMNYQIQGGGIPGGKAFGEKNLVTINSTEQTITKDFFVKGDAEGAELQFAFGNFTKEAYSSEINSELTAVSGKVYISNVQIVKGPELENQAPVLTADNVVLKTGATDFLIKQGVKVEDDRDTLTVENVKATDISEGDKFVFGQPAVKGVYKIEYQVKDSGGLEAKVTRTITVADPWNRPQDLVTTTEKNDWDSKDINGWFVRNLDLPEGTERWISATSTEGETKIEISAVPDGDWRSSFRVANVQYFKGTYTIKFKVKADDARIVRVAVEGSGLDAEVAYQHINVTTEWKEITLTYVFDKDYFDKGFDFWFGTLTTVRAGSTYTAEDDILTNVYLKDFTVTYAE
ncbi:MAG: DUF5011 domain-containing protein [Acholeplasma sp.]|nr:DUF5011 domain-containing protein [Acholeplasma sp.]